MEISQWQEPDVFSKLNFDVNKTLQTWGKSLLLWYGLSFHKRPRLDILGGRLREVLLYLLPNGALVFRKCFSMQIQIKQAARNSVP